MNPENEQQGVGIPQNPDPLGQSQNPDIQQDISPQSFNPQQPTQPEVSEMPPQPQQPQAPQQPTYQPNATMPAQTQQQPAQNQPLQPQPQGQFSPLMGGSFVPPQQPAQTGQFSTLPPEKPSKFGWLKKKRTIIAALVCVFLLLIGGTVFAFYTVISNKPENVWKSGISNTGKVVNYVVDKYTTEDQLKRLEKSEFNASLKGKAESGEINGSINGIFDSTKLTTDLKLKADYGGQKLDLGFKLKASIPDQATYPDLFFQLTGIKDLGLDAFVPGISDYDGKWISVPSDYIEEQQGQLTGSEQDTKQKRENITRQDVAEAVKAANEITQEYVFSTDPAKAILENREYIGKEKVEDVTAFHYHVGFNKENYRSYCKALSDKMYELNITKKFEPNELDREKSKKASAKSCDYDADNIGKKDPTFDMWINKSPKIIYKIRVSSKEGKNIQYKAGAYEGGNAMYTDIGQKIEGKDKLKLFVAGHSDKDKYDLNMNFEFNGKEATTKGDFSFKSSEQSSEISGDFSTKPYEGDIDVSKPSDAIDIRDVMKNLGLDGSARSSQSSANQKLLSNPLVNSSWIF